jgi:diguanylate cyclase (GGDEF)-like protein
MEDKRECILVVDDSQINRDILKGILKNDYRVLEAENGLEALNLLDIESTSVSAILLDIMMPVMDGYDFLAELKKKPYSEIPVIIMTGNTDPDTEEKALHAGACDFVLKPYQPMVLLSRLGNAIARSQVRYLQRIQHAAEHDPLTDLYNQAHFFRSAQKILQNEAGRELVLACFSIDRFQILRSMWGEKEYQRFMLYTSTLLRRVMSDYPYGRYALADSSTFCFLTEYDRDIFSKTINDLIIGLSDYDRNSQIEPSIGIYRTDNHTTPVEKMYLNASIAMHTISDQYHHYTCEYQPSMGESLVREQGIVNEMETALSNGQFIIYLQPKYNLQTNTPYGAEALVRWNHPTKGLISPGLFIPVFEKNGFIGKLDVYVWETVCRLLRKWIDDGIAPAPISVNMSRADLYNSSIVDTICSLIRKYKLKPELLNLELTESTYMDNPKLMAERIHQLQKLGFCIMMDDFGSAYSSLNMLKDIQVDYLKIDMKFIQGDIRSTRSERVMASVVRMAGWLDLPVIVEGVETKEQYEFLQSIGCGYIQGYYFAKPMTVSDYENLIAGIKQTAYIYRSDIKEAANVVWSSSPELNYLIDALPQPMAIYEFENEDLSILRMNASFQSAFGYSREIPANNRILFNEYLTSESRVKIINTFWEAINIRGTASCDYRRINKQGDTDLYRMSLRYLGKTDISYILIATFVHLDTGTVQANEIPPSSILMQAIGKENRSTVVSVDAIKEALRFIGTFSDSVRIVDPVDCSTVTFTEDGSMIRKKKNCYLVWGKNERCSNCTSRHAVETNKRQIKYEVFGNQTFLVTSAPVAVNACGLNLMLVIEIINCIGSDTLTEKERKKYMTIPADDLIYRDKLTKTFNRSYLNRLLMIDLGTSINYTGMAVIMIRIGDFKGINLKYGRLTGNMVLEQTARILMQNIREQDRVVRMGGDDFLVILMGCGQAEAAAKAEEFRKEAGKLPYSVHDSGYIRLEAGISSRDHFDQNPSTLKQMIDEATADRNQADRTAV